MKGDFTRSTFRPEKQYTTVRMQQGRVQLDSDWNEQVDIFNYLNQIQLQDLIGVSGIVRSEAHSGSESPDDCEITLPDGGKDLAIAPGRIYVDGILCNVQQIGSDLTSLTYTNQPYHPNALKADLGVDDLGKLESRPYIVYLDVWQRHITAIEDPEIRELALNGLDTTTRTKTVWQVKLATEPNWNLIKNQEKRHSNLTAELITPGSENQLYRVEIHKPGPPGTATFKWSRDNGSMVSAIEKIEDNIITVSSAGRDTWQSFAAGQWIEITDEEHELNNQPGTLVQLLNVVSTSAEGSQLVFDASTTEGVAVTTDNFPLSCKPKVRRWDHDPIITDKAVRPTTSPSLLDKGIEIKFDNGSFYQTGDYWLLPVRENQVPDERHWSGKEQPAQTIAHHYCHLATVEFNGSSFTTILKDGRVIFPSLINCLDKQTGLGTLTQALGLGQRTPIAALDIQNIAEPGQETIESKNDRTVTGQVGEFKDWVPGYVIFAKGQWRSVSEVISDHELKTTTSFAALLPAGTPFTFLKPVLNARKEVGLISTAADDSLVLIPNGEVDFSMLHVGDIIIADSQAKVVQAINPGGEFWKLVIDSPFDPPLRNRPFTYQQPIVRFADSSGKTQMLINDLGNVGIGTTTPAAPLDVKGKIKADTIEISPTGSFEAGEFVGQQYTLQRVNNGTKQRFGSIQTFENEGDRQIQFIGVDGTHFAFLEGNVSIMTQSHDTAANLTVDGSVKAAGFEGNSWRLPEGNTIISGRNAGGILINNDVVLEKGSGQANLTVQGQATVRTLKITDSLQLRNGQEIIEFSIDRTFNNASNQVVPTQLAVKSYVDDQLDERLRDFTNALSRKANLDGSDQQDFSVKDLRVSGALRLPGSDPVTVFTKDGNLSNTTSSVPTDKAVREFVDGRVDVEFGRVNTRIARLEDAVNDKADRGGSEAQNFSTNNLTVQGILQATTIEANRLQINPNTILRDIPGRDTGLLINNDVVIERGGEQTANLNVEGVVEAQQFRGNRINIGNASGNPDAELNVRGLTKLTALNNISDALQVNGAAQFTGDIVYKGTLLASSSRELKDAITDLSSQEVTDLLQNLAPVKYVYKADPDNRVHVGFIAEDTPDLITSSDKKAVSTLEIVAILTKAIQDHRQIVRNLSSYVDAQQREIVLLQTKLSDLEQRSSQRSWFR